MAQLETAVPKEEMVCGVPKWEAENAADTLMRSFEIKRDAKRLKAALSIIRKRQKDAQAAEGWAGGLKK